MYAIRSYYGVSLAEEEFGEVGAVLAGDAGDQGNFRVIGHRRVL